MWQYVFQINQTIRVDLNIQLQNLLNKSATSLRGKCDLNCDSCPNALQSSSHGCLPRRYVLLPKIRKKRWTSRFHIRSLHFVIFDSKMHKDATIAITFPQSLFIFKVPVVVLLVLFYFSMWGLAFNSHLSTVWYFSFHFLNYFLDLRFFIWAMILSFL